MDTMSSPSNLVQMFNSLVDYVRQVGDGIYEACAKERATHQLQCTRWNTLPKIKPGGNRRAAIRDIKTRPEGYALSVCAVPYKQLHDRSVHKLVNPLPAHGLPAYDRKGSLKGKRSVLTAMVATHKTPTKMARLIAKLPHEKCDALYKSLLRANRRARRKAAKVAAQVARKASALKRWAKMRRAA